MPHAANLPSRSTRMRTPSTPASNTLPNYAPTSPPNSSPSDAPQHDPRMPALPRTPHPRGLDQPPEVHLPDPSANPEYQAIRLPPPRKPPMKQNCYSLRPGTILEYKFQSWRVIANDTLLRTFTVQSQTKPRTTKTFRYRAGQEISIIWSPDERV